MPWRAEGWQGAHVKALLIHLMKSEKELFIK